MQSFLSSSPPQYLFTSGLKNRYNPQGVKCLYMGETRHATLAENDQYDLVDSQSADQSIVVYKAFLDAAAILDLTDSATRRHLGLTYPDIEGSWRRATSPTLTQELGLAVSMQDHIAAIRYRSIATKKDKPIDNNFVIFKHALTSPDIFYPLADESDEQWPTLT